MDKKGLCSTCVSGKSCSLPSKFPIVQCEEFSNLDIGSSSCRKKSGKRKS